MKKIVIALLILTGVLVWDVSKEGKDTIIVYSSLEQFRNDALQKKLEQHFPDEDIYVMYMSTAKAAAKISTEQEATDADIVVALETAYLEEMEDQLTDVREYSKLDYLDQLNPEDGKYLIWERQAGSIIVNKEVLKKYDLPIPKTYEDLLDERYKGLIAMPDPKSSGTGYFFYKSLVNQWGEEKALTYFDALAKNVKQFTESGSGPVKLLIQQEVAVGLGLTFQGVNELNEGNPFELIEPEFGSPYSLTGAALVKGREKNKKIEEVFQYIVNDCLVYDKEQFSPEQVLKKQNITIPHYPESIQYADMSGIEDINEKERLLAIWKY